MNASDFEAENKFRIVSMAPEYIRARYYKGVFDDVDVMALLI